MTLDINWLILLLALTPTNSSPIYISSAASLSPVGISFHLLPDSSALPFSLSGLDTLQTSVSPVLATSQSASSTRGKQQNLRFWDSRDSMGFCGIPGILWDSMGFYVILGILWDSVGFQKIPRDSKGFYRLEMIHKFIENMQLSRRINDRKVFTRNYRHGMLIVIINQRKQEWYFVKHELEESVEVYKGRISSPLSSVPSPHIDGDGNHQLISVNYCQVTETNYSMLFITLSIAIKG